MANDLDQAFIQTYETNVRHLAQQGISRLRPFVQEVSEQSEAHNWETLDEFDTDTEVRDKALGGVPATRLQDTPNSRPTWEKRRTLTNTHDTGTSTEQEDIVQMLVDPNSNLAIAQAYAMRRKVDDIIILGAFKPAPVKSTNPVQAPIDFPMDQIIDAAAIPINFDLITAVNEKFLQNDIEPEERKVFIIGPTQMRKLLQLTEATNVDYVHVKSLSEYGYVHNWMGYDWIVSTRLNDGVVGGPGPNVECIAMTDKALGLHIARDMSTKVAEDPSASFAWRIYTWMSMDCVRVEDKHIVKLDVLDQL